MSSIKKVRTDVVPGEENVELAPDGLPYKELPAVVRDPGYYFDARVPAEIIDTVRQDARSRSYPNSTIEAAAIRQTDEAVFEKVRAAEGHTINQARGLIERNSGRVGQALSYVDQLEALRERLRAGEDTKTVAKEFAALERTVRGAEIRRLNSMVEEARSVEAALADPVGHTQHLYSLMPLAYGRSAGLVRD